MKRAMGIVIVLVACVLFLFLSPAVTQEEKAGKVEPVRVEKAKADKEKPFVTSLTVYPVTMSGNQMKNVGEVVGLILEQNGFRKIRIAEGTFKPKKDAAFDQAVESFGAFVKKNKIKTDYALYCEYLGGRKEGVKEIRSVVVDRGGKVVFKDIQTPKDAAFRRLKPDCPMTCCVLVAGQLKPVLIPATPSELKEESALARLWAEKSGVPAEKEYDAMEVRLSAMKKMGPRATVVVFPIRTGKTTDPKGAEYLVSLLNEEKLCEARLVKEPLWFEIKPNSNEQRILWDMAKAFQAHMRKNAPDADYGLFCDYMISSRGGGAVHFAVCDKKGDWVIVDFQNNHHDDFKAIDPRSVEDGDRLVVKRLAGYLR